MSEPARRRLAPLGFAALTFALGGLAGVVPAWLADWLLPAFAVFLVGGPSLLYPWLRRRGSGVAGAGAGALCTPLVWLAKECAAVGRLFGVGPGLYYAVNPIAFGLLTAGAVQMAVAEIVLGRRAGNAAPRGAWTILLAVAALAAGYAALVARRDPTMPFWLYVEGYRRLFGAGG